MNVYSDDPRVAALFPDGSTLAPPLLPTIPDDLPAAFKRALRGYLRRAEKIGAETDASARMRMIERLDRDLNRAALRDMPPARTAAECTAQQAMLHRMQDCRDEIVRPYWIACTEHCTAVRRRDLQIEGRRLAAEAREAARKRAREWGVS